MARLYRAEAEIAAPAERVWALLTDLDGYARWNPFTTAVHSDRVVGHELILDVRMGPRWRRIQRETLLRWDPGDELRWGLLWHDRLFVGERWQRVEVLGPRRCRYETGEQFRGLFAPLVDLCVGDRVQAGFEAVAAALREAAEARCDWRGR